MMSQNVPCYKNVYVWCLFICIQRAEGMLKSWEALQQKERDEKYSFLKQRVKLQHDLIAKADQLSGELRVKAEEEYQEVSKYVTPCLNAQAARSSGIPTYCGQD